MTPAQPTRYIAEQLETTPAYYYFTSGTSDVKKAVIVTHRNVVAGLFAGAPAVPETRILSHIEMHHVSQLAQVCHSAIYKRSTTYFLSEFSAGQRLDRLLGAIEKYKITDISLYPWLAKQFVCDAEKTQYDLSSLRTGWSIGAQLEISLAQELHERLGLQCFNLFGMTECGAPIKPSWDATLEGI